MKSRFDICVSFVLDHETEYNADKSVRVERDPHDPGGATKYGIDQRSHPNVDVARLTLDQARFIYRTGEWTKCCCENLKPGWDLAVFDAAVNMGSARAVRLAQEAVHAKVDGFIGPKTIATIAASSIDKLEDYLKLREAAYRGMREELRARYLTGWLRRVADVRAAVCPDPAASTRKVA